MLVDLGRDCFVGSTRLAKTAGELGFAGDHEVEA